MTFFVLVNLLTKVSKSIELLKKRNNFIRYFNDIKILESYRSRLNNNIRNIVASYQNYNYSNYKFLACMHPYVNTVKMSSDSELCQILRSKTYQKIEYFFVRTANDNRKKINEFVKVNPTESTFIENKSTVHKDKPYSTVDIFIHLAPDCANGFGHIDISFENTTYSYGTYDSSSNRLFTLVSDGVLIEVETDKYIEILNTQFNRSLIGFTLALTKDQHELIKNRINKIKSNCYLWKCPAQLSPNGDYTDETNIMYLDANCKYYKFKSGYFKTYFTLTANCVRLADTIVGSAGLDLIAVNGIITPGTYYNYLENLFRRKNSIVIKKKIYKKYTNN